MRPARVALETWEVALATYVGERRAENAQGRLDRFPEVPGQLDARGRHVIGAVAELAVAKFTLRYWPGGFGQPRFTDEADVPPDIEVRWRSQPSLIVRPNDRDDRRYVLAGGKPPQMLVLGWLYGLDAKRVGERARDGAVFVPAGKLADPAFLIRDPAGLEPAGPILDVG